MIRTLRNRIVLLIYMDDHLDLELGCPSQHCKTVIRMRYHLYTLFKDHSITDDQITVSSDNENLPRNFYKCSNILHIQSQICIIPTMLYELSIILYYLV